MIPSYINDWLTIIEQMKNDNTYKLAWGRAIIECISLKHCSEDNEHIIVDFDDISRCMIKYYWNQMFFFHLKQSPYKDKEPIICSDVNQLIDEWKKKKGSLIPKWYSEEEVRKNNKELFDEILKDVSKTLHENVSWRFKRVSGNILEIYRYDKNDSRIFFYHKDALLIRDEYGILLSKLLNYKWTQLLETFNHHPRIALKVSGISDNKLKRYALTKYKEELLKEHNGKAIDFYTGEELSDDDISIDHVIPWSFMYSDDIWNLVITSRSHNSSKSNSIPDEEVIERLKERNERLKKIVGDSYKHSIEEAMRNDYLDQFYYQCRV